MRANHGSFAPRLPERLDGDIIARAIALALAFMHLLALVSLVTILFTVAASAAENDLTCGARDLVGELRQKDPAAYARLRTEGDRVVNSQHRLWKIEKDGMKPSWLLGTMHLTDPRVTELPSEARTVFEAADKLIVESDEILDEQIAAAKLFARPDLMMFTDGKTITDYLSEDDKKVLEEGLLARGIPLASIVTMKPYIVASMVSLTTCELSRKASGTPFLDKKLALEADEAGKDVVGVETLAEQIEAMASLPIEFHVRALVTAVRYPDYTANMMETTLNLYLDSQIGLVFPAGAYFAPEKNAVDLKDMALFEEKLITIRNRNMAERAAPILEEGNVFMAVGALHLMGDQGIVELLRRKGFRLSPVI